MTIEISSFLKSLSSEWEPVKDQAKKYFDSDSKIREDGAAQIFRRPWIAPLNFGLLLFPPVDKTWFAEFNKQTDKTIPEFYQNVLSNINGCFVYDFALYGLPRTLYTEGLLSRRILQQYDLGRANTDWIGNYNIDNDLFHIGGRSYSYDENIGYFLDGDRILSIRKNGEVLNSWATMTEFLKSEIEIVEKMMIKKRDEE